MESARPQGARQSLSLLVWGGKAGPESGPGLWEDITRSDSLFRRPARIGNVTAKVASIMDDADTLLLEGRAKGGGGGL